MVNLAGWRFLVFALISAASIVLLASIGVPTDTSEVYDRHTGQRKIVVRNVADAFFEARATGNAAKALAKARIHLEEFPEHPVLERVIAILEAELGAPDLAPSHFHPDAATVAAEQARATRARGILDQRLREPLDRQALLALLDHLEADEAVAQATDAFFAPLLHQPTGEVPNPLRPDEWAVRRRAELKQVDEVDDPKEFLELAQAFRANGRMRARIRWLLRAYAALPPDADLHAELAGAYLESGRTKEAFLVIGAALPHCPDELALWERRAQLAGWLALPREEAEAHEVLLKATENLDRRRRLLTLYQSMGQTQRAVPHARVLARGSDDLVLLERPAILALQGAQVDLALEILEEQAERGDNPVYWREKIIEYAWQDLRLDRVESELAKLRDIQPEGDYEQRLEKILRQRDKQEELLVLLEARLANEPDNRRLEQEVLQIHAGLDHREEALAILQRRVERETDPRFLFAQLTTYHALGVDGLAGHAQELARSPLLEEKSVAAAIDNMRPLLDEPGFLDAALIVARRFPHQEASRTLLVEVADREASDSERALAAETLAKNYPADAAYTRAWVERSSWAGETESEVRAREAWIRFEPDDTKNRCALGHLYSTLRRPEDAVPHWRYLTEREGLESESVLRLIDSLFASDQTEEAIVWLEKRASLPGTSVSDRLHVATQLFGRQQWDRALRFYLAVLDLEENNPESLLRIGQIRSWTNDPRGAVPFLERRLEQTDELAAEVRFYLGEANWALRNEYEARRYHRLALEAFQQVEVRTTTQDVMVAKMLTRFGRFDEAQPIFERVLEIHPDHVDLILDYADSMVADGKVVRARELVDRAKLLEPDNLRVMRLDGSVALREDRYLDAATILEGTLEEYGPDAGAESELGRARELHGDRALALAAYERSLTLQPDNRDVEEAVARLADELAGIMSASLRGRIVEDDTVFEAAIAASTRVGSDRTRAGAFLGYTRFSGRSQAVDGGNTDVTADVFPFGVSLFHRYELQHSVGGGLVAYPGAPGDAPVGGWAGLILRDSEPYRILGVRLLGHVLLDYPAAAPGLGGRRSGVLAFGQHDLGERFWVGLQAGYDYLSVEVDENSIANGHFDGSATFGWRIHKGSQRVAEPLLLDRGSLPGLVGPDLAGDPDKTVGPLVSVWTSYQMVRLMGDEELANVLPIGTDLDYLSVSGRGDFHLARGIGAKVEASLGTELNGGTFFGQLEAGVTWRPSHRLEGTLTAGYGLDMQRANQADAFRFRLGVRYRW